MRSYCFPCNDVPHGAYPFGDPSVELLALDTDPVQGNVRVRLEAIAMTALEALPPRLADLLDIAVFAYVADGLAFRGETHGYGGEAEPWSRSLRFQIAVRDPDFWRGDPVGRKLAAALRFLSDDEYSFEFFHSGRKEEIQLYLGAARLSGGTAGQLERWQTRRIDRVAIFPGDLDSLAGVAEAAAGGESLALVGLGSAMGPSGRAGRRLELVDGLRRAFGSRILHVPVMVRKHARQAKRRDHLQRTRPFLDAVLGFVAAQAHGVHRVSFFKNGAAAVGLPLAQEVLSARASRAAHPRTLALLEDLFRELDADAVVDNPYLERTLPEVLDAARASAVTDLVRRTCSCHEPLGRGTSALHCGYCEECIERRLGIKAAGLEQADPASDYRHDPLLSSRPRGYERSIAVQYARHALELAAMPSAEIAARFGAELARASLGRGADAAREMNGMIGLHKRHGRGVARVLAEALERSKQPPAASLLGLVLGRERGSRAWRGYASAIAGLLAEELPAALQPVEGEVDVLMVREACEAVLSRHASMLGREHPLWRWTMSGSMGDWPLTDMVVRVEARLTAGAGEAGGMADEEASGCNSLLVVYDAFHGIPDIAAWCRRFGARRDRMAVVVRGAEREPERAGGTL